MLHKSKFDQSTYINNVNQLINLIKEEEAKKNSSSHKPVLQRTKTINVAEAFKTIKLLDEAFAEVEIPKENKELNDGGICRALVTKWQRALNAKYYNDKENISKLNNFERRIKWITGLQQKDLQHLVSFIYQKVVNIKLPQTKKPLSLKKKITACLKNAGFKEDSFKGYINDDKFLSVAKAKFLKKIGKDEIEDDKIGIFTQYFVKAVIFDQLEYVKKLNKVFESAVGAYNVENQNYALETGMTWLDTYPITTIKDSQIDFIKNFDKPKSFLRFYSNRHVIGLHMRQKSSGQVSYDVYDPNETKGVQSFHSLDAAVQYINLCLEGVEQNLEAISVFVPDVAKQLSLSGNYPELEKLIEDLAVLLPFFKDQSKLQAIINSLREANKIAEVKKDLSDFIDASMENSGNVINDKKQTKEFLRKLLDAQQSLEAINTERQPKKIEKGLHHSLVDARNVILQTKDADLDPNSKIAQDIKNTAKLLWEDYNSGRVPLVKILKNYSDMLGKVKGLEAYRDRIRNFYDVIKAEYSGDSVKLIPKFDHRVVTHFEQRSMFNAAAKTGAFYWFLRVFAKPALAEKKLNEVAQEIIELFKNDNGETTFTVNDLNNFEKYLLAKNGSAKNYKYFGIEKFDVFKEKYNKNPEIKEAVDLLFRMDYRLFLNAGDVNGYKPLYEAITHHHFDVALYLIQAGAQTNLKFTIKKDEDEKKQENEKQESKTYLQALVDVYKSPRQTFKDADFKTLMVKLVDSYDFNVKTKSDLKNDLIVNMHEKKDYNLDVILALYNKFNLSRDLIDIGNLVAFLVEDFQYEILSEIYSLVKTKDNQQQAYFLHYLTKEISRQQGSALVLKETKFDHTKLAIPLFKEIENANLHTVVIDYGRGQENFLARVLYETANKLTHVGKTFADDVLSRLIDKQDELKTEVTPFVLVQLMLSQKEDLLAKLTKAKLTPSLLDKLFRDANQRNYFGMLLVNPQRMHQTVKFINNSVKLRDLEKDLFGIRDIDIQDKDGLDYKITLLVHLLMLNIPSSEIFTKIKDEINTLKKLLPQDNFKRTMLFSALNYYRGVVKAEVELVNVIDELEKFPAQAPVSVAKVDDKVPHLNINDAEAPPVVVASQLPAFDKVAPNNNKQTPVDPISIQPKQSEFKPSKILHDLQDLMFSKDWPVFGSFKLGFFGSFKLGGVKLRLYDDEKRINYFENTVTDTMQHMLEIMANGIEAYKAKSKPVNYMAILENVYKEGHKRCKKNGSAPSHKEEIIDKFYQLFAADSFEDFKKSIEGDLKGFGKKNSPVADQTATPQVV